MTIRIKSILKFLLVIIVFPIYCSSAIPNQITTVVFTGGPSTGKTTLINALAQKGFCTVKEAATSIIQEEFAAGNDQP